MAEYVSAVLGLISFGLGVSNNIYKLIDALQDAPNELLALSNEVTDFQLILDKVKDTLRESERHDDRIANLLDRCKTTMEDVDALIKKAQSGTKTKQRVKWLQSTVQARKL
jgi:hypothetical protein